MRCGVKNVAYFFSKKETPALWPFSNMAGGMPIRWRGILFNSSEQLYQASKYHPDTVCIPAVHKNKLGIEPHVQKRIIDANNPRGAKMTQKCAVKAGLVRPDWPKIMVDCMLWVLELKLQQNRHTFGEVLKSTGSKMIVEKSSKDTFWGCIQEGDIFDGQNQLGLLLVKVRENYDRTVKERQLTHPNGFLILPEDMAA
ncbi:MAG: NADAR family protein [Syntrophobacteraceae bacterium]